MVAETADQPCRVVGVLEGELGEAAEVLAHALADRLQRLEAGPVVGGLHAHAFGIVVVDGDEHRYLPSAVQ